MRREGIRAGDPARDLAAGAKVAHVANVPFRRLPSLHGGGVTTIARSCKGSSHRVGSSSRLGSRRNGTLATCATRSDRSSSSLRWKLHQDHAGKPPSKRVRRPAYPHVPQRTDRANPLGLRRDYRTPKRSVTREAVWSAGSPLPLFPLRILKL